MYLNQLDAHLLDITPIQTAEPVEEKYPQS